MIGLDRTLGFALAAAIFAGIAWASHTPMAARNAAGALLRLAWSARPERIENCRQQSEEELMRLPAHMRQQLVCEGAAAQYRLAVRSEGRLIADQLIHAGGLRQDRRLYVFREIALPAGETCVEVQFDRVESSSPAAAASSTTRSTSEPARNGRGEAIPPRLAFAERVTLARREVMLVTYDPQRRILVAVRAGRPGGP